MNDDAATPAHLSPIPRRTGPGGPRKRAGTATAVKIADFTADDDVINLKAIKLRLSEMLARPDLLERDMAALNKDYRKVIVELKDAQTRVEASKLGGGGRRGLRAVPRTFDGDI